jgi:hypothetical protein
MIFPDGIIYDGEILDGLRHGNGCNTYTHIKTHLAGKWENDVLSMSFCEITYNNGHIYRGEIFVNSKNEYEKNGIGTLIVNGDSITGKWDNGIIKSGTITDKNLGIYYGEIKPDEYKKHGEGKYIYPNGDIYEGGWHNNQKSGFGMYIYEELKCIYNGLWLNDKKNGEGIISYKDLDGEFVGIFENDLCKEGYGISRNVIKNYIFNGLIKNDAFVNGLLIELNNRKKYIGSFKDGKKNGYMTVIDYDGLIMTQNDLIDNIYNGIKKRELWKNGVLLLLFEKKYDCELSGDQNICSVCFDEFPEEDLFPICNNSKCNKIACNNCLLTYFSKIKPGCYIGQEMLLCMFCKINLDENIIRFNTDEFLNLITLEKVNSNISKNDKSILAWCKTCKKFKKIIRGNCEIKDAEPYICDDCDVDKLKKILKIKHCPHCNFAVTRSDSKDDGCHHMTCRNCEKYWCWFCIEKLERTHGWKCAKCGGGN